MLEFLDQVSSFYERNYIKISSLDTEGKQVFIDKVIEFAGLNGLPSKGFESSLAALSDDNVRNHLNKVYCCSLCYIFRSPQLMHFISLINLLYIPLWRTLSYMAIARHV